MLIFCQRSLYSDHKELLLYQGKFVLLSYSTVWQSAEHLFKPQWTHQPCRHLSYKSCLYCTKLHNYVAVAHVFGQTKRSLFTLYVLEALEVYFDYFQFYLSMISIFSSNFIIFFFAQKSRWNSVLRRDRTARRDVTLGGIRSGRWKPGFVTNMESYGVSEVDASLRSIWDCCHWACNNGISGKRSKVWRHQCYHAVASKLTNES